MALGRTSEKMATIFGGSFFECIFPIKSLYLVQMSMNWVHWGPVDSLLPLVHVMARRRTGDK